MPYLWRYVRDTAVGGGQRSLETFLHLVACRACAVYKYELPKVITRRWLFSEARSILADDVRLLRIANGER